MAAEVPDEHEVEAEVEVEVEVEVEERDVHDLEDFLDSLTLAAKARNTMDSALFGSPSSDIDKRAADARFAEQIVNCEHGKVTKALRVEGRDPNDTLHFGPGEMAMTGLEYAVWRLDVKMAALFFVQGGDPVNNKCDGYVPTYGSVHGNEAPDVLPGFETEDGEGEGQGEGAGESAGVQVCPPPSLACMLILLSIHDVL